MIEQPIYKHLVALRDYHMARYDDPLDARDMQRVTLTMGELCDVIACIDELAGTRTDVETDVEVPGDGI